MKRIDEIGRDEKGLAAGWTIALALLIGTAQISPAAAREDGQGYIEARASAFTGTSGDAWQTAQRLRPTLNMRVAERANLVVTLEAGLAQGRDLGCELRRTFEESDLGPLLDQAGCEWPDRGHSVLRVHDSRDYLDVDRLYLDIYQGSFDLRVGRQSLHWGSGQFFNPTDPFPEVLLAEPWRPRRGINAVRATIPFGAMNDVMAVAAIDDSLRHARLAGRVRFNFAGFDTALVAAWRGDTSDTMLGVDLRGTNVVGWWLEAAVSPGDEPHTELVAGIDYSFPVFERMVVMGQYYRNGAGATRPSQYRRGLPAASAHLPVCGGEGLAALTTASADDTGEGSFDSRSARHLARDYLLLGAMFTFTPDVTFNAFMLQNLNDGTALAIPTISYLATDHLELSLSAQLPFSLWGEGGELEPRSQDLRLEREVPGSDPVVLDLSGLVPTSTITLWARFSF